MTEAMIKVLSKIQKDLKAPKGQHNKFGGYNYRNCEDILEALKPLLPEGIAICLSDEIIQVADRIYVKAIATLTNGKDLIQSSALAREPSEKKGMDASQITGAASSYARKYALNGLFCIDDTKDADSEENAPAAKAEAKTKPVEKPEAKIEDQLSDKEANEIIGRIRKTPQLSDLEYVKGIAAAAIPRMTKLQKDTIGMEVKKRAAFFAQAPNDDLEANIGK